MKVPFLDIRAGYKELEKEINKRIEEVLDSGWYIDGESVARFENEFAGYCGTKYCIGVGNGLNALEIILKAYGIGEGDEVIVPANTYIATVLAVTNVNAGPVFVEPELITYNIDPEKIEKAITKRTKAIIAVHLYGQCANIKKIKPICKKHKLLLIEDAAQAHGAEHFGQRSGNLGISAGFSFYPGKNLGAYGDAGAVVASDKNVAEYSTKARNYGQEKKYINSLKGTNSRLDELQAAILSVKLKYLDAWNERRQKLAKYYLDNLNPNNNSSFILPQILKGNNHVFHLFVVRIAKRQKFMEYLTENNIGHLIHYPLPSYKQEAYKEYNGLSNQFPITNDLSEEIISLPMGPHVKKEEAEYVVEKINKFIKKYL